MISATCLNITSTKINCIPGPASHTIGAEPIWGKSSQTDNRPIQNQMHYGSKMLLAALTKKRQCSLRSEHTAYTVLIPSHHTMHNANKHDLKPLTSDSRLLCVMNRNSISHHHSSAWKQQTDTLRSYQVRML